MALPQLSWEAMHSEQAVHSSLLWLVLGLFGLVIALELITPADYVFSYLYIGPILLANLRLSRRMALWLTLSASVMVLFNLWIPGSHVITPSTVGNRLIAVSALGVTEVLSRRNRYYEEAIARQRVQIQLQAQLASLRQDFISTLTHDLKTPLLGAIETLKALQQERFGSVSQEQQTVFATMRRSHQGSLHLVETVLDIYRNDAEGVSLTKASTDLIELVQQSVEGLRDLARSYQVVLCFTIEAVPPEKRWVEVDALQLRRVIANLLMNAINHSPSNSEVAVHLRLAAAAVLPDSELSYIVEVQDQGPGIGTDELPQLFERFYQGRSNRQAKGSGLGLYLSRQIVEGHGGRIWACSRTPCGAVFSFCLPAT